MADVLDPSNNNWDEVVSTRPVDAVQRERTLAPAPDAGLSNQQPAGSLVLENGYMKFYPNVYPSKQIKDIGFTKWDGKSWKAPKPFASMQAVHDLRDMFGEIEVSPELLAALDLSPVDLPQHIESSTLFSFQKKAVQFALTHKRALIALKPGRGKSAVGVLSAAAAGCEKILIVCPKTLMRNWQKEIHKWVGADEVVDLWWKERSGTLLCKWVIANYDTVRLHPEYFRELRPDCIIVDETIIIKNRSTKITKAIQELVQNADPKIAILMSGAPTSRYYSDLWSQLNILNPNRFSSFWRFTERYCHIEANQWSAYNIVANKADAPQKLQRDLSDIMFVADDAELQLPDWIFQEVEVPMSARQQKLYSQMESEFLAELSEDETLLAPNVLSQLIRLVQLASNPLLVGGPSDSGKWDAIPQMLSYIQLPVIIWTSFIRTAQSLAVTLQAKYRVATLTGETPEKERQAAVDKLQAGELDVIIAHPGVGKFGLTMTAARSSIYMERGYSADDYYQSLHRIKRIGTTEPPYVYHLLSTLQDGSPTVDHAIGRILKSRTEDSIRLTSAELKKAFTGD